MNKKRPKKYKKFRTDSISTPTYVSQPILIDITTLEQPFHRAEIVIQGIDRSAFSYEGRVFLNNPQADQESSLSLENGYVGSFHIFGYGGLFPEALFYKDQSVYDYRALQSPLLEYKRLFVTDALRILGKNTNKFYITIVPVLRGGWEGTDNDFRNINIVRFVKIGIVIR